MFVEEKAKGEVKEVDETTMLLLRAAALIEERGHCKYVRENGKGSFCVLGAIDRAAGYFDDLYKDELKSSTWWSAVSRLVESIQGDPRLNWRAADWNNASERTKEEVVGKLRAAAFSH
jgi:hypothetical protein